MAVPHCFDPHWNRYRTSEGRIGPKTKAATRIKLPNKKFNFGDEVFFDKGRGLIVDSYYENGETVYRVEYHTVSYWGTEDRDKQSVVYQHFCWRRGACLKRVDNEPTD